MLLHGFRKNPIEVNPGGLNSMFGDDGHGVMTIRLRDGMKLFRLDSPGIVVDDRH